MEVPRGGSIRARTAAVATACFCLWTAPALAQYSQPLFLEAARDPGRAETPATARSLALAGARAASGLADDAPFSPAGLMLARGTDVVFSAGWLAYARNELAVTPAQLPPWDPTRAISPRSTAAVGYVALATRGPRWAAAGFYDATSRYRHEFETATADLRIMMLQGQGFYERGAGGASARIAAARVGGAVAVAPWTDRLSLGIAVYGVRLDYRVASRVEFETWVKTYTDPTFRKSGTTVEEDQVRFLGWAPGFVVSGMVTPVRQVALAARWQRDPQFTSVRELTSRSTWGSEKAVTEDVQFRLPGTFAVAGTVWAGRTMLVTEIARTSYGTVFAPQAPTVRPPGCDTLETIYCSSWAFGTHRAADATTWRAAVEQPVSVARGTLFLRGGISFEQGYTLARSAADPRRNGGSLPEPPVVSPYEPPREGSRWLSCGAGYAWRRVEIAAAFGRARHQNRILVDVRLRAR